MSTLITGKQVASIIRIFTDGKVSSKRAQVLIDSGLIADLRDTDLEEISRAELRKFLGLPPLNASGFQTFKVLELRDGTEIELVIVSNADLGFENGATLKETCNCAQAIGLDPLSAVILDKGGRSQLETQYGEQPIGEEIFLGEPRLQSGGNLHIFCFARDANGNQHLKGCFYEPAKKLASNTRWIFLRPQVT